TRGSSRSTAGWILQAASRDDKRQAGLRCVRKRRRPAAVGSMRFVHRRSALISFRRDREPRSIAKALSAAETLAQHGRRLQAIDVLTAANRSARDDEIEQRLVRLRHDAFDELDVGPGLAAWPPEAPDLFPATAFPEVQAGNFTAETLRSGILRHGCLCVRGLVPPKRVKHLTDDIEAAMPACEAWEIDGAADTAPWAVPPAG